MVVLGDSCDLQDTFTHRREVYEDEKSVINRIGFGNGSAEGYSDDLR